MNESNRSLRPRLKESEIDRNLPPPPSTISDLDPNKGPPDHFNFVYLTCMLIGTTSLLPVNVLIAALGYMGNQLPNEDNLSNTLVNFSNVANGCGILWMIFYGRKTPFWFRMVLCQIIVGISIFILAIIYYGKKTFDITNIITHSAVEKIATYIFACIMGASSGIFSSSVAGYSALYISSDKYIAICISSMTFSALIPDALSLLCLIFNTHAVYYFLICGIIFLIVSLIFFINQFTPMSKYFIDGYTLRTKIRRLQKQHFMKSIKKRYVGKRYESTIISSGAGSNPGAGGDLYHTIDKFNAKQDQRGGSYIADKLNSIATRTRAETPTAVREEYIKEEQEYKDNLKRYCDGLSDLKHLQPHYGSFIRAKRRKDAKNAKKERKKRRMQKKKQKELQRNQEQLQEQLLYDDSPQISQQQRTITTPPTTTTTNTKGITTTPSMAGATNHSPLVTNYDSPMRSGASSSGHNNSPYRERDITSGNTSRSGRSGRSGNGSGSGRVSGGNSQRNVFVFNGNGLKGIDELNGSTSGGGGSSRRRMMRSGDDIASRSDGDYDTDDSFSDDSSGSGSGNNDINDVDSSSGIITTSTENTTINTSSSINGDIQINTNKNKNKNVLNKLKTQNSQTWLTVSGSLPPILNRSQSSRFTLLRAINRNNQKKYRQRVKEYLDATQVSIHTVFWKIYICLAAILTNFAISFMVYPLLFPKFSKNNSYKILVLELLFNCGDFIGRKVFAELSIWHKNENNSMFYMTPKKCLIICSFRILFLFLFILFNNDYIGGNNVYVVGCVVLIFGITNGIFASILFIRYTKLLDEKEQESGAGLMQLFLVFGLIIGSYSSSGFAQIKF